MVASQQATAENTVEELIQSAETAALDILRQSDLAEKIVAQRCVYQLRDSVLSKLPGGEELIEAGESPLSLNPINNPYPEELEKFNKFVAEKDLYALIARYPLHKSQVLDKISKALGCRNKSQYEQMVLAKVQADDSFARKLKRHIAALAQALRTESAQ